MSITTDFLIIGGGVIGLSLACEIRRRHPDSKIVLIEKEKELAAHASGRNSGVLHAGFYYTADSQKARFTRDGNKLLRQYCEEKNLKINQSGKLVVAQDEKQLTGLKELQKRGERNGVELYWITEQEARDIEPCVRTFQSALWSPTTATVDPKEVVASLADDARLLGVDIQLNTTYLKSEKGNNIIKTSNGNYSAGYVINAAGLYADRVALEYGFSESYRILPFKGLYLYADQNTYRLRTNIYPVPDLNYPFLGVHFTLSVDGKTKIGPTAIPAFWREHYRGFNRFNVAEFKEIMLREAMLFFGNHFGFRDLAFEEMRKYRRSYMMSEASKLLQGVQNMGFSKWGNPGIRAQLIDIKRNRLEMDFIYQGDNRSFHILNAVSPAFTCSLSFSRHLADEIQNLTN